MTCSSDVWTFCAREPWQGPAQQKMMADRVPLFTAQYRSSDHEGSLLS